MLVDRPQISGTHAGTLMVEESGTACNNRRNAIKKPTYTADPYPTEKSRTERAHTNTIHSTYTGDGSLVVK